MPEQRAATFEAIEEPLGRLDPAVLQTITDFFVAATTSRHYAMLTTRRWPVVESFRALAATYPMAMWVLRFVSGGEEPTVEQAVDIVGAIDRGERCAGLTGRRHRVRIRRLARMGQLQRLAAWYAR